MIKNDTAAKFCLTAVFFVYAGFICFFKLFVIKYYLLYNELCREKYRYNECTVWEKTDVLCTERG